MKHPQFGTIESAIFRSCNRANLKSGAKVELRHRIDKGFSKIFLIKNDNSLKISLFLAQKFCDGGFGRAFEDNFCFFQFVFKVNKIKSLCLRMKHRLSL